MSGKVVLEYHNRNAQRKAVYAGYEIFGGDESISKA